MDEENRVLSGDHAELGDDRAGHLEPRGRKFEYYR